MAFNPFNSFRKHKTGIFAGLVIICMLTFILSSGVGRGDFFDWVITRIGASSRQGLVVTTLYGKKVYEGELQTLAKQREFADRFLRAVLGTTAFKAREAAAELLGKKEGQSRDQQPDVADFNAIMSDIVLIEALSSDDRQAFIQVLPLLQTLSQQRWQQLMSAANSLRQLPASVQINRWADMRQTVGTQLRKMQDAGLENERRLAEGYLIIISTRIYQAQQASQGVRKPMVFGGSTRRQDLLDFLIWQKQADILGIKFTDEDVRKMVNSLCPFQPILVGEEPADTKTIASVLGDKQITLKELREALVMEYRASLAQAVILGDAGGLRGVQESLARMPTPVTPVQYLDYYREQRTQHQVELLPVPVSAFLSDRLPQPSEQEIVRLYEQYKNDLPRPEDSRPGFKLPQRFRIEWVRMSPAPVEAYKHLSQVIPLAGFLGTLTDERAALYRQKAEGFVPAQIASLNPLNWAWLATIADVQARGVLGQFDQPGLFEGDPAPAIYTARTYRYTVAATIGQLISPMPTASLEAVVAYPATSVAWARRNEHRWGVQAAIQAECASRSRLVAGLVGLSLSSPVNALIPGAAAGLNEPSRDFVPPISKHVPVSVVRSRIMRETQAELERLLLENDLGLLAHELRQARDDEKKCRTLIDEAVKKYKLQAHHGRSTMLNDPYNVSKDPGLAPLLAAYKKQQESMTSKGWRGRPDFASEFTNLNEVYTPTSQPLRAFWGSPDGSDRWQSGNEVSYLYWKTEHHKERHATLAEVRDEVIQALKLREARKIAQEVANQIRTRVAGKSAAEVQKLFNDPNQVRKLLQDEAVLRAIDARNKVWGEVVREVASRDLDWGRPFTLEKVARQAPGSNLGGWVPYPIPESKIAYPTSDFVDRLLKLEPTQAAVLRDAPERIYYVCYMESREQPPSALAAFRAHSSGSISDDPFLPLDVEQRNRVRQTILEELRREAGKIDSRGRLVLNPDLKEEKEETLEP